MQEPLWEKRLNGGQKGLPPMVTAWYSGEPELGSPINLHLIFTILQFEILSLYVLNSLFEGQKRFI